MRLLLLLLAVDLVWPSAANAFDALESDNECQQKDCVLNALQQRTSKSSNEELQRLNTSGGELRIYQWNPHWQCFYLSKYSTCKQRAKAVLNGGLQGMGVDFANVIELVDDTYNPPAGFGMLKATCNEKENALLIYDKSKWRASTQGGARVSGCIRRRDRAFNVQMFESVNGFPLSRVVVVGAHYPHSINVPRLRDSLASVVHSTGVEQTIFIGDTNQEQGDSHDVARALNMKNAHAIQSSPLFVSCCHKVNAGFVWKFDRIITNFGRVTDAGVFEVPWWAAPSMHKAVHAKIQLS